MSIVIVGDVMPMEADDEHPFEAVSVEPFATPALAGKVKFDLWTNSENSERLALTPQECREIAAILIDEAERVESWQRREAALKAE